MDSEMVSEKVFLQVEPLRRGTDRRWSPYRT